MIGRMEKKTKGSRVFHATFRSLGFEPPADSAREAARDAADEFVNRFLDEDSPEKAGELIGCSEVSVGKRMEYGWNHGEDIEIVVRYRSDRDLSESAEQPVETPAPKSEKT